jgi:membrane complex biogenesis BtpA family protein
VQIFADVHVKHAVPLGNWPLDIAARDTQERGLADALIVSGTGTGEAVERTDLETVRRACPTAKILLGSGVSAENVRNYAQADGFIVGSSLKSEGKLENPVDPKRVERLAKAIGAA